MTLPITSSDAPFVLTKQRTTWGPLLKQNAPSPPRLLVERFAHLDMTRYRTAMSNEGYVFFVTFTGIDMLGFSQEDFEDFDSADDI